MEAEGVSNFFLYDPENDFDMVKEIGRGGTSRIFEVISKTTKEHYALKYLSPHTSKERTLYINEFIIGALSPHTNILKYHRLYIFSGKLYVIQELMDKCLYNVLCPKMPDSIIAYVLKQTLQGLSYLHGKNRVHRDIKSDNILLNPNGEIKLADLGFAVQLTQEKDKRNTLAGSPCWIAPEILNKHPYGTPVDIWSLGVVLIEMLEGNPPNLQKGPKKAMQIIKERGVWLENPDNFNPEFTRFLSYCLNPDPLSRKSANELLEDELIRSAASQLEASTFFMQKKKI